MEPYVSHIVSGETGLLAGSKEEWLSALNALKHDINLRSKLVFNARFVVKDQFDIETISREWYQVYNQLLSGAVIQ